MRNLVNKIETKYWRDRRKDIFSRCMQLFSQELLTWLGTPICINGHQPNTLCFTLNDFTPPFSISVSDTLSMNDFLSSAICTTYVSYETWLMERVNLVERSLLAFWKEVDQSISNSAFIHLKGSRIGFFFLPSMMNPDRKSFEDVADTPFLLGKEVKL
jgi:hypothetical protein